MSTFVGEFTLPDNLIESLVCGSSRATVTSRLPPNAMPGMQMDNLLTGEECARLLATIPDSVWEPVGYTGILREYVPGAPVGSLRASCFSEPLADTLWHRLAPSFPEVMNFSATRTAPTEKHARWRPVGLNPLMRFIRYDGEGLLVPHYDGPYIWNDSRRSLMSLVIYLSKAHSDTGNTRFLWDNTEEDAPENRRFEDWTRLSTPEDIRQVIRPAQGRAIAFNHWLLHDSEPLPVGHQKIIIRTDVAFEKC